MERLRSRLQDQLALLSGQLRRGSLRHNRFGMAGIPPAPSTPGVIAGTQAASPSGMGAQLAPPIYNMPTRTLAGGFNDITPGRTLVVQFRSGATANFTLVPESGTPDTVSTFALINAGDVYHIRRPIDGSGYKSIKGSAADANIVLVEVPDSGGVPFFKQGPAAASSFKGNSFISGQWGTEFGNQTLYAPFAGPLGSSAYTTFALAAHHVRVAGSIKNLSLKFVSNTLTNASTLTLYQNGNPTSLTVSVAAGVLTESEDTAHTVTFASGDLLAWQRVIGGAGDGGNSANGAWHAQVVA